MTWVLLGVACVDEAPVPERPALEATPAMLAADSPPWFEDVAAATGIAFQYVSGHDDRFLFPEIMGGGVALFDLEGDGDLDVYFVQGGALAGAGSGPGNRLWRNRGVGLGAEAGAGALRFDDITAAAGAAATGYGMGVTVGDYDGDGDADLYVTNVGPNVLLANRGDGTFADVTAEAGVGDPGWGTGSAFFDYDRDGDLDLFVANYVAWSLDSDLVCAGETGAPDYCSPLSYSAPQPDVLFRNDGGGRFTDVSSALGLRRAFGNGLGVVVGDFDGDAWPDVFVANDQLPNQLWRNLGGAGKPGFTDVALQLGCAVDESGRAKAGMGTAAADVDADGDLDLLVVNLQGQSDSLFLNQGGWFQDAAGLLGLGTVSRPLTRFGVGLSDFDNDAALDLFAVAGRVTLPTLARGAAAHADPFAEPHLLLRGDAAASLEPVVPPGGTKHPLPSTSRGAAFGDLDNDGGVDVLVVNRDAPAHVLRNAVSPRGRWAALRLLTAAGADAIGAHALVSTPAGAARRLDVAPASSYLAANDPRLHFGLAGAASARVVATWPDGCRLRLAAVVADRLHVLPHPAHRAR